MPSVLRQHPCFPACHRCQTTHQLLDFQLHFPMLIYYTTLARHQRSTRLQLLRRSLMVNNRHSSGSSNNNQHLPSKPCSNKDRQFLNSILQIQTTTTKEEIANSRDSTESAIYPLITMVYSNLSDGSPSEISPLFFNLLTCDEGMSTSFCKHLRYRALSNSIERSAGTARELLPVLMSK